MGVLAITIDQGEGIISFAANKVFEKILRSASDILGDYYKRKVMTSLVFAALMAPDDRHLWCVRVCVCVCECECVRWKID
jgi:hypothetical protein